MSDALQQILESQKQVVEKMGDCADRILVLEGGVHTMNRQFERLEDNVQETRDAAVTALAFSGNHAKEHAGLEKRISGLRADLSTVITLTATQQMKKRTKFSWTELKSFMTVGAVLFAMAMAAASMCSVREEAHTSEERAAQMEILSKGVDLLTSQGVGDIDETPEL